MENINNYFELISKLLNGLKIPLEKYKQRDFNIFTAISDTYYKEKLHSGILTSILNPFTPRIGNMVYLHTFLEETDKDLISYFQDENCVKASYEKDDIDILIENGKYCIILENKIHNASNQPNQLCRYYNYARQKGLKVLKIFYIPLNRNKVPNIEDYCCNNSKDYKFCKSCTYKQEIEETKKTINKLTQILNIADLEKIIKKCAARADTVEYKMQDYTVAKVFLEHYSNLLFKLRNNMADEKIKEKDFLAKIFDYKKIYGFSNKDMNNLAEITKIWANRESILKDILTDRLLAKDYIQVPYHQHLNDNILRKEISGYYIIFYPAWGTFALEPKNWDKDKIPAGEFLYRATQQAKEYFRTDKPSYDYSVENEQRKLVKWVHLNFVFSAIEIKDMQDKNPMDSIVNNAVKCFTRLEEILKKEV